MTLDEEQKAFWRQHQSRLPPKGVRGDGTPWKGWFTEEGHYLGESSARQGPDQVPDTKQKCGCYQCEGEYNVVK